VHVQAALLEMETQRLAALRRYQILDTPREKEFDDIVAVLSAICETPISVINLIDEGRQWFKAEVGLGVRETPLPASICAHAILQRGLFVVPDTLQDRRFSDNPLVVGAPGLRFYAGALLETSEGFPLGTICVLDYKPRVLNDNQKALLRLMASQIMKLLDARLLVASERAARAEAEALVKENEVLVRESDHRVMNSLTLVSAVLALQSRGATPTVKAQLEEARRRVHAIAAVHRELHQKGSNAEIEVAPFLKRLCESLKENAPSQISDIALVSDEVRLPSETASALGLMVAELVGNSFKHAFPGSRTGSLSVAFSNRDNGWTLTVTDDGVGLPPGFDPSKSKGVGMRVIMSLAKRLNATLEVKFRPSGAAFVVARLNS
jgi:two-component sensor histidine kinase